MKTNHPYYPYQQHGDQIWGINISSIPKQTTENEITNEFKKYGDIFSIKSVSSTSMNIVYKSPKKINSIDTISNDKKKFKVTSLDLKQSSTSNISVKSSSSISSASSSVAKLSLMGGNSKTKSSKIRTNSIKSPPPSFASPPSSAFRASNNNNDNESVFFELVSSSINQETTEEQVLDFISSNIFNNIRKFDHGMMILPGKSMAMFELNKHDAVNELTTIINTKIDPNLKFNGNKFSLKKKVADNASKGLTLTINDDDDDQLQQRTINSNGINIINNINGHDYLMGFGFEHGLDDKNGKKDDKKDDDKADKKNFCFSLPAAAKMYVQKQAESLEIPTSAMVLMLGVLTTNGPVPVEHYRGWKQALQNNANNIKSGNAFNYSANKNNNTKTDNNNNKNDIIPNLDALTDSSDKNSDALNSDHKGGAGEISMVKLAKNKSRSTSNNGSPVGSLGSTAAANLFDIGSVGSKKSSTQIKKVQKKMIIGCQAPLLTQTKSSGSTQSLNQPIPTSTKTSIQKQQPQPQAQTQAPRRVFNYPTAASSLFSNSSQTNLLNSNNRNNFSSHPSMNINSTTNPNNLTVISPRGVSLIHMNSGGLLSPTSAILSPRRSNNGNNYGAPPPVVVPNTNDFNIKNNAGNIGNGFSMTTPLPALTPVHIPYMGNNNGNGNNGLNTGFSSPFGNSITPHSPIGNFSGITPIINGFTPTAAITPTAANGFNNYIWNVCQSQNKFNQQRNNNNNNNGNNNMNNMNNINNQHPMDNMNMSNMNNMNNMNMNMNMNNMSNNMNNMNNNMNNMNMNNMNNMNMNSMNNMNNMSNMNMNNMDNNNNNNSNNGNNMFYNNSNNPYVQKQLQNQLNPANSLLNGPSSNQSNNIPKQTFFKYPNPTENTPKTSPSNSGNNLHNNMNNNNNNDDMNDMNNNNNNNNNNNDNGSNDDDDGRQMDHAPTMNEINSIRNIPSVISPNGTTPVVMITNLNEDQIDCDKIFTLCGVFGDVQRVKISYHKRDTAFVQLSNHRQAKHVVTSLNRMQLYGKMIHVNLSRMTRVKLPKDSPNSAMMFPDAKFLTKDYTNCKKHRYSKKGSGGIKYSPLSIGQPSHILHIANLPIQSEAKDLQEFLCGNNINNNHNSNNNNINNNNKQKGGNNITPNSKIQAIELIGVNNKLGSCQAFAKCHSVDIACQILIDYHSKEFLGREIKISFATRSHMPSDINKTHKTYSYTTAKKIGSSINSIPTSLSLNNHNNNNHNNHNNSEENISQSSSSHSNGHNNSYNSSNNSYHSHSSRHNSYGSYHNNMDSHHHNNHQRNSYMSNYDNSVGYQTYVINNKSQNPPDQDKIFVRQHHHSGGRKYHYKLRINK